MTDDGLNKALAQALSSPKKNLRFHADLEARFRQDIAEQRNRAAMASGGLGLCLYVAFLVVDWLVVPDVFGLALVLRLVVILPLGLLTIYLSHRHMAYLVTRFGPTWADWTAAVSGWAAAGTLLILWLSSQSDHAYFYHAGLMVVMLYTTLVQPTRFMVAVTIIVGILGMHGVAIVFASPVPEAVRLPMLYMVLFAMGTSLLANYLAEKHQRRRYLLGLRDTLILQELQAAQAELQALSRSDALTRLANRRHFDEHLQHTWSRASLDGLPLSMLMIDVDHFKAYNDALGHQAGDTCLKAVAQALLAGTRRPDDLVARIGGEEFGVLLSVDHATALQTAERVCAEVIKLRLPHPRSATSPWVTVSVGVVTMHARAPLAGPQDLIDQADKALYDAKREGRNRVKAAA